MRTYGDDSNTMLVPNTKSEFNEPEKRSSSRDTDTEDAMLKKLENIVLKSDENDTDNDGKKDYGIIDGSGLPPLRPYAGDCPHYVRTGSCKFGLNCRYNHPDKRIQAAKDVEKDVIPQEPGQIECKYYQTTEGCKYGKSCRFWHRGEESGNNVQELNFLGLPIRLGEKECPFYMRNGTCGYGSRCVFNHPEPTPVTEMGSPNSSDEKFRRQLTHPSEKQNGGSLPIHFSGTSQPGQASLSFHTLSDNTISYPNIRSTYVTLPSPPHHLQKQSEWNGYQAPNSHQSGHDSATPYADGSLRKTHEMKDENFPERPGQPECGYFMKTGNCKFRSACRYHHPKDRKSSECVLSEKGLPLRPGRSICRHYESHGLCKFGSACLFDHPVNHGYSAYPDWHASETAADCDAGSWGD